MEQTSHCTWKTSFRRGRRFKHVTEYSDASILRLPCVAQRRSHVATQLDTPNSFDAVSHRNLYLSSSSQFISAMIKPYKHVLIFSS